MQKITDTVNLVKNYLSKDLDAQQKGELQRLLVEHPDLKKIIESLENKEELQRALDNYEKLYSVESEERQQHVLNTVLSQIRDEQKPNVKRITKRKVAVYAAIAAVIAMVFFTTVIWRQSLINPQSTEEILSTFGPGVNKAILTLSNGQRFELTESHSGIIVDGDVMYEDGTAIFEEDILQEETILTLSTPRGGQYQVTLPDGTKVFLNAESKLHYPYRFSSETRGVELEGEAYFEVAHQRDRPFIVTTAREKVEVLGTHFNITSYEEDHYSAVALVEGKVKVSLDDGVAKVLTPGLQSVVASGEISVHPFNIEEAIAWKNGEFMFNNESIASVMKKLSRWYDIEIDVDPKLNDLGIWGSLSRHDDFSTVLNLIKMTDDRIRIQVKGRSVKLMK